MKQEENALVIQKSSTYVFNMVLPEHKPLFTEEVMMRFYLDYVYFGQFCYEVVTDQYGNVLECKHQDQLVLKA